MLGGKSSCVGDSVAVVVVRSVLVVVGLSVVAAGLPGCAVGVSVSVTGCRQPGDVLNRDYLSLRPMHALPDQQEAEVGRKDAP